jgi:hypothetical protein
MTFKRKSEENISILEKNENKIKSGKIKAIDLQNVRAYVYKHSS